MLEMQRKGGRSCRQSMRLCRRACQTTLACASGPMDPMSAACTAPAEIWTSPLRARLLEGTYTVTILVHT